MTSEPSSPAVTRTWRDIPQPVKPRAMSSTGRVRLAMAGLRTVAAVAAAAGLLWGGWLVAQALRTGATAKPAAARAVPLQRLELRTDAGGVLDDAWLKRTLALPKGVALMELDLPRLRARLLEDRQVLSATLTRHFPDRLAVQIAERSPVARIRVRAGGTDRDLLVARDGVVYEGNNYDPGMVATLPWLAGIRLKPAGADFEPIPDMATVAELLARAQYEATHLYLQWQAVSLERLAADRELEVTAKDGSRYLFSAKTDFFPQLAKLDNILEHLRDPNRFPAARVSRARIDLSLGREVPVMLEAAPQAEAPEPAARLQPGFNILPLPQSKSHP